MVRLATSLLERCRESLVSQITTAALPQQETLLKKIASIDAEIKNQILRSLDLDLDVELAGMWIEDERYWRRRCERQFKTCMPQRHGNSWKQVFFEKLVSSRLESYDSAAENVTSLQRLMAFSKKFVRSLQIYKLPSHLDLELIFQYLAHSLCSLTFKYSPGELGMKYERTLFGMKLSDSRSLARVLEASEVLTELDISNNLIDDDKLRILCSGMLNNISLTRLNLSKNRISDRGARALAKVLQQNQILVQVDLSDNCIFQDGAHALARALKHNKTLTDLNLSLNRLGDEGMKEVLEALMGHPTICSLHLAANGGERETAETLCRLLKANTALQHLDLSRNAFAENDDAIREALLQNGHIHKLALLLCGLRDDTLLEMEECLLQRAEARAIKHMQSL